MNLPTAEASAAGSGFGQILLVLIALESLRQIHFVLAEHSAGYHQAWLRLFARTEKMSSRWSAWNRYRLARVFKWVVVIALGAVRPRGRSPAPRRSSRSSRHLRWFVSSRCR